MGTSSTNFLCHLVEGAGLLSQVGELGHVRGHVQAVQGHTSTKGISCSTHTHIKGA
jgi:hypothetical protein